MHALRFGGGIGIGVDGCMHSAVVVRGRYMTVTMPPWLHACGWMQLWGGGDEVQEIMPPTGWGGGWGTTEEMGASHTRTARPQPPHKYVQAHPKVPTHSHLLRLLTRDGGKPKKCAMYLASM